MNIEDVSEWIKIADDDLEKYLKGFLESKDIIPEKTHNLIYLNSICIENDIRFTNIKTECDFLNKFANDIRYPHRYETKESEANFCINAAIKIRDFAPINDLRNIT